MSRQSPVTAADDDKAPDAAPGGSGAEPESDSSAQPRQDEQSAEVVNGEIVPVADNNTAGAVLESDSPRDDAGDVPVQSTTEAGDGSPVAEVVQSGVVAEQNHMDATALSTQPPTAVIAENAAAIPAPSATEPVAVDGDVFLGPTAEVEEIPVERLVINPNRKFRCQYCKKWFPTMALVSIDPLRGFSLPTVLVLSSEEHFHAGNGMEYKLSRGSLREKTEQKETKGLRKE